MVLAGFVSNIYRYSSYRIRFLIYRILSPVRLATKELGVSIERGILNVSFRRIASFTAVIILEPYLPTLKAKRIFLNRKPYF